MEIYEGVVDYLENFNVDDRDMNKFISERSVKYRPPDESCRQRGSRSMNLYMSPRDRGNDPPGKSADSFG